MEYIVNNVPYVAQKDETTCWNAAYRMMLKYKSGKDPDAADRLPDAEKMKVSGIMDGQFLACRAALGLTSSTYKAFLTVEGIKDKLDYYGPIWVSGNYCSGHKHILVVRGVRDPIIGEAEVYVNDPYRGYKSGVNEPKWVSLSYFKNNINPVSYACQHWDKS